MAFEGSVTPRRMLVREDIDQPYDAGMRLPAENRQLAEVLVDRNQHAMLFVSDSEDGRIARVIRPITRPHHVVTEAPQLGRSGSGQAGVEKKLHFNVTAISTRSIPTTRVA